MSAKDRQKGVALVMVLSLVALVSVWAVNSAEDDMISIRRAENMQFAMRAMLAAESALELSRLVLKDDDSAVDSFDDDWAQPTPAFPVDEGIVAGEIVDGRGHAMKTFCSSRAWPD